MAPPGAIGRLGPYVLESLLARGGMGSVYRARRDDDGALVAVKVLLARAGPGADERRRRFEREAELTASLRHPGIVRVHAVGEEAGSLFIAMDLIAGATLAERVGRVDAPTAAGLVAGVARAMAHAHERGVLHRDLKPQNVLIRADDGQPVVTDFGVARALMDDSSLTRTGALVGTPAYMAPEQIAGKAVTPATDVHALGVLLYELVTGEPPFRHDDLPSLAAAIVRQRPEPPSARVPGTPAALDEACLAALHKEPARRPTAAELAATLEQVAAGAPELPRGGRRGAAVVAVVVLTVALAAAGAVAVASAPGAPPRPAAAPLATQGGPGGPGGQQRPPPAVAAPPAQAVPAWASALLRGPLDTLALARGLDRVQDEPPPDPCRRRLLAALQPVCAAAPDAVDLIPERRAEEAADLAVLERAVFAHALRRALDPTVPLPRTFLAGWTTWTDLAIEPLLAGERGPLLAEALVRLSPDELNPYVHLSRSLKSVAAGWEGRADRARVRHLELLARGATLALLQGHSQTWARLTGVRARLLAVEALLTRRPGDLEAAEARLTALLEEPAPDRDAAEVLGLVLACRAELRRDLGRLVEATSDLDRALELVPHVISLRAKRALLRLLSDGPPPSPAARDAALRELHGVWSTALPLHEPAWCAEAEAITDEVVRVLEGGGDRQAAEDLRRAVARHEVLLAPALDRLAARARAGADAHELMNTIDAMVSRRWIPGGGAALGELRQLRALLARDARAPASLATELAELAARVRAR